MKLINRLFPSLNVALNRTNELGKLMEMHGILSDVIPRPPRTIAEVKCYDGTKIECGSEIVGVQLLKEPSVTWTFEKKAFYFLCMLDPDAPSRKHPTLRHWQHWLIGNIPECNIHEGNIYTEYIKPCPSEDSGLHRYVFLIYKQPGLIRFPFQILKNNSLHRRGNFSIVEIARRYNLNNPIAGNFVHAKFNPHMSSDILND